MNQTPIVAIVGRPNVGKSTLFNRLLGKRYAIIAKEAGTTRDSVSDQIDWDEKSFILVDTAGLIFDFYGFKEEDIEKMAQDKLADAITSADLILFIVDAQAGILPEDKRAAKLIRKYAKNVLVVFNKADNERLEARLSEVDELGFKDKIAISSITGRRSGLLLDKITKDFKKIHIESSTHKKISIIGRPNAGKSTLFNILADKEQAIVSNTPGTTRDSVRLMIKVGKHKEAEIIDTAGFRRRGRIEPGIEKFSVLRAIESVHQSDIVILVVDSKEGFTRTDAHLADLAIRSRKKLVVVLNKIDLLKEGSTEEVKDFDRYGFIRKNTIIGISSLTRKNVDLLTRELVRLI